MQRYFFHVKDGETHLDEVGFVCADHDAVRAEALTSAGDMLRELGPGFWDHSSWTMWVVDEAGATVLTLEFAATLPG